VTVTYANGQIPSITSNADLNAPGGFGWIGGRVNIQDEVRHTDTKGARFNVTWGDDHLNLRAGAAYDDVERTITALDNSQAWQNAICGDNPSVFVPGPNSQPPCEGLNSATPVSPQTPPQTYPTYPGLGTNFSTGMGPLAYRGSLIPATALAGFLRPGPDGFITVDWAKLASTSNYNSFQTGAPTTGASNTGANGGFIGEKVTGLYTSLNGDFDFLDHKLRYNAGVRWVQTKQDVGGRVSIADPRNAATPAPADGGKYPNIVNFVHTQNTYNNYLPSLNLAYSLNDNAILRFALSKTMTRPDPNAMLPGLNFSSPSADIGTVGNSALGPFTSKNVDLGLEIYTNDKGYVSLAAFRKSLTGFTLNGNITVPFSSLAAYGVDFSTLTPGQQQAINARGGPDVATVVLTQQVNAPGHLVVDGMEFGVVQSLDFLLGRFVNGFGISANATIIDQSSDGAAVATGVSPRAWNLTAYYEQHGVSARISGTFTAGSQISGLNQNGIGAAALFADNYKRWDFSSSFDLAEMFGWSSPFVPQITFDVANLDKATQRQHFQFGDATYALFNPSRTYILGIRGKF
jgi:TonB-dependent receptor